MAPDNIQPIRESRCDKVKLLFYRYLARKFPATWFRPPLPILPEQNYCTRKLKLEIVSHCWNYSNLMAYQLSSFVLNPPTNVELTITIYYSPQDKETEKLLAYFRGIELENINWNWRPVEKPFLFRRAIGRNQAGLNTEADWVWYADCDLIFADKVIDNVCEQLKGTNTFLAFPNHEHITELLPQGDPRLREGLPPETVDICKKDFRRREIERAVGAFQIVRGDLLRKLGYCDSIPLFQKPTDHWKKTYEDTIFRWLIGTQGEKLNTGGTYRIRHVEKGRYKDQSRISKIRKKIRSANSY